LANAIRRLKVKESDVAIEADPTTWDTTGTLGSSIELRKLEKEMELVYAQDPMKLSRGWGVRPSGMTILFTAGAPTGSRIKDVKIEGKEMQPDRTYTIGGCEQEGEALDRICRLSGVSDARYVPGTVHGALRAYVKANSPIDPRREGRVRATDLPAVVWSQYGTLQKLRHIPGDAAGVVPRGTTIH
jgi:hypothetical protein